MPSATTDATAPKAAEVEALADALDISELDVFLAAYSDEPDGDLVNREETDDLLTWGVLRRVLASVRSAHPSKGE